MFLRRSGRASDCRAAKGNAGNCQQLEPSRGDLRFPGGESRQEALERVLAVLRRLEGESFRTAGVAVHGGTMAAMLNHFGYKFDKIPNCAVFRLHFENGEGTVEGNLF